jgi:hypothetical protein
MGKLLAGLVIGAVLGVIGRMSFGGGAMTGAAAMKEIRTSEGA